MTYLVVQNSSDSQGPVYEYSEHASLPAAAAAAALRAGAWIVEDDTLRGKRSQLPDGSWSDWGHPDEPSLYGPGDKPWLLVR